ncbi:hypothetical protein [Mycolicibacterium palauense]|uniref:hypothetical protein n=1 Tax=Mycolicibacterium palauense TaxID=2034511 RepID=UPI000BFF1300|nr:hypothetical protein [Mycolicibacterium palauense]
MKRTAGALAGLLFAGGVAMAVAPVAAAEPGANEPLMPSCEGTESGGGGEQGGATTECTDPGNAQLSSTPSVYAFPWEGWGGGMWFM